MGYYKDITGQRFGKLVAIEPTEKRQSGNIIWRFRCDCGNIVEHVNCHLTNTSSCGCEAWRSLRKDITGQKFGRLTAIRPTRKKHRSEVVWLFQCDCGNLFEAPIGRVTSGNTTSCGCAQKESRGGNYKDLTGERFGMLTVTGEGERKKNGDILWNCICDCGKPFACTAHELKSGIKLNCGCNPKYKFYCIYKHVFPDGRVYIGKTSRTPLDRWTQGYKSQFEVYHAIQSIPGNWIDLIDHFYLSNNEKWIKWERKTDFRTTNTFDVAEAHALERKWIKVYDSINPQHGLNGQTGGDYGFRFNEKSKERNRNAQPDRNGEKNAFYGKKHSKTVKIKLSEYAKDRAARGDINFKGQHHTEATKQILREKALARYANGKHPSLGRRRSLEERLQFAEQQKKPITQYSLNGDKIHTFPSVQDAAKAIGASVSSLSQCALMRTKESCGFIWRYVDYDRLPSSQMPEKTHALSKSVHQYDKNGNYIRSFDSISEAAKAISRTTTSLCTALKNGTSCAGYKWKYADSSTRIGVKTKAVIQMSLDGTEIAHFDSVKEEAEALGIDKNQIACAARGVHKTSGGFRWKYES